MAGIDVPALRQKFDLLIAYGHFENWDELARAIGRKKSTLDWWCHGDESRSPNTLSGNSLEPLLAVLAQCFPAEMPKKELMRLFRTSANEFEAALMANATTSLNRLIKAEAQSETAKLIVKKRPRTGLIETEEQQTHEAPSLRTHLGTWFRLEFKTKPSSGHVWALQHAGQSWGVVSVSTNNKTGHIYVPGLRGSTAAYMVERHHSGLHRFIIMQTPAPPPTDYFRYLNENIALEAATLGRFAHQLNAQPKSGRNVFIVEVQIDPA